MAQTNNSRYEHVFTTEWEVSLLRESRHDFATSRIIPVMSVEIASSSINTGSGGCFLKPFDGFNPV